MKILPLLFLLTLAFVGQSQVAQLQISDFEPLDSTNWEGTLMYVNYRDGKQVELPTQLAIRIKGETIIMATSYPNEPKANGTSRIRLDNIKNEFGKEPIEKVEKTANSTLLVTRFKGNDDNKPATLIKTYFFAQDSLTITKEVLYDDQEQPFVRNKFTYSKIK